MIKVGSYGFGKDSNDIFYINESDNTKIFYLNKECTQVYDEDSIKNWAEIINSPWSQAHENYIIKLNCKDAYTKMDENEPQWVCIYEITGFECIQAEVIGYGNTEEEALKDCKDLFKYLQDNFNKENISF